MHANCRFLEIDGIRCEADAVTWSVNAAVQRNRVYCRESGREAFREAWKEELCKQTQRYAQGTALSDSEHCKIIAGIADRLSLRFPEVLSRGRLRFGTSQKALNLWLKYLWHFEKISEPPHCPFDGKILKALKVYDAWTRCNDQGQYMSWVSSARKRADGLSLSKWECEEWLRRRLLTRAVQCHNK